MNGGRCYIRQVEEVRIREGMCAVGAAHQALMSISNENPPQSNFKPDHSDCLAVRAALRIWN